MGTFTVALTGAPAAGTTITLKVVNSNNAVATVTPAALTFTPTDWYVPQTVTIVGINDNLYGNRSSVITLSIDLALSDPAFKRVKSKAVTITVLNDEPLANPDFAAMVKGDDAVINLLGNDSDPNARPLTVSVVDGSSTLGAWVDNGDGTVSYAAGDIAGTETFTYELSNDDGCVATGQVSVDIGDPICKGMAINLQATDLGLTQFAKTPVLTSRYCDPLTDPWHLATKTMKHKLAMRLPTRAPCATDVFAEYAGTVRLFDAKALTAHYATGGRVKNFTGQKSAASFDLWAKSAEVAGGVNQRLNDRIYILCGPLIGAATNGDGSPLAASISAGGVIKLTGFHFGKSAPKVYLEYTVGGKTSKATCKVLTPLAYPDLLGKVAKSCTDSVTGESTLMVQLPTRWPRGWIFGPTDLVLDNGVGLATVPLTTAP